MEDEVPICFHGSISTNFDWQKPQLIAKSEQYSRPGYTTIKANQFQDSQTVLKEKVKILAKIIKQSQNCVVYTGAGISRASGIADYASKAKKSIAGRENASLNRLNAVPTKAHYILTEMEKNKYIKHWVQQNHDGLAQKSGFPISKINQIHGSWFDKKNPVVLMDDCLKQKNYSLLKQWQEKVDICLAIGTSLCGMRSDGIAKKSSQRDGLIIINLQQTPYDQKCLLRIYGNLQQIMDMLRKQLSIKLSNNPICITNPYQWNK